MLPVTHAAGTLPHSQARPSGSSSRNTTSFGPERHFTVWLMTRKLTRRPLLVAICVHMPVDLALSKISSRAGVSARTCVIGTIMLALHWGQNLFLRWPFPAENPAVQGPAPPASAFKDTPQHVARSSSVVARSCAFPHWISGSVKSAKSAMSVSSEKKSAMSVPLRRSSSGELPKSEGPSSVMCKLTRAPRSYPTHAVGSLSPSSGRLLKFIRADRAYKIRKP